MMAVIIVDGYNLIRSSPSLGPLEGQSLEKGRLALIKKLAVYQRTRGHQITVVFDAAQTANLGIEEDRLAGIRILFSQRGQSADAVIIGLAHQFREGTVVVTSDRTIQKAAIRAGCGILESREFERMIYNVGAPLAAPSSPEMLKPEDDEEPRPLHKRWITKKKGPSKRLPKAKRRALKKLF